MSGRRRLVVTAVYPVRDFEQYLKSVEANTPHSSAGSIGRCIYRSLDDPNEVMIQFEVESEEDARMLLPRFGMRVLLDQGGVDIYPAVFFGEEVQCTQVDPEEAH